MWNIVQSSNPACQWICCGAIWLICISLGSSSPEAYYVLCAVCTNCIKWTHAVENVSAERLSNHFICVTEQITIKFSVCVCCKCCHVNFIFLIVNQVCPLLHTKSIFKLTDVLIEVAYSWRWIFILWFSVLRGRLWPSMPTQIPRKTSPLCVWTWRFPTFRVHQCIRIFTQHRYTTAIFITLHLFVFACGNYVILFDKPEHLDVMLGRTQISVSTVWMCSDFRVLWPKWLLQCFSMRTFYSRGFLKL